MLNLTLLLCILKLSLYLHPNLKNQILITKQMKKLAILVGLFILFFTVTAFSWFREKERSIYIQQPDAEYIVQAYCADAINIPGYGKTYLGFKEAIGFKESQGRYSIVNSLGYLGKYQFGTSTLQTLRIHNAEYFLYNSKLQEKAFKANCSYNKWLLQDAIDKHIGTTINGIEITESGIIAAAHLAGAGSVKRFLRNKGNGRRIMDAYGTNIEQYLKKFANYDISNIEATKRPRL